MRIGFLQISLSRPQYSRNFCQGAVQVPFSCRPFLSWFGQKLISSLVKYGGKFGHTPLPTHPTVHQVTHNSHALSLGPQLSPNLVGCLWSGIAPWHLQRQVKLGKGNNVGL